MSTPVPPDLIEILAGFSADPLGFVLFAFPWGTGELTNYSGPEGWQEEILIDLGKGIIDLSQAIRLARTSGHGIGKSAFVSWLILWGMSTYEDTIGVITANTETQLKTKTWAQLAKWFRLFIGKELFDMTATKLCSADPAHKDTWRLDMVPWSVQNTEAFAGLHNQGKRILVIFDEASSIPDLIWEVTEGALTDQNTEIIWAVFGNPTKNKGRFRDCFHGGKFAHRWQSAAIDSREVSLTDKKQIQEWIEDYGEDSDFVRVRVRGVFPRVDVSSFISFSIATEAVRRPIVPGGSGVIIGVDVGRFGDDPSVIYPRSGRDAVSRTPELLFGTDTMETAARVAAAYMRHNASVCFVDGGGVGGGVVDRLRMLRVKVIEVDFGGKPVRDDVNDRTKYANRRAEMWGRLREWLRTGSIPDTIPGLTFPFVDELTGPGYSLNSDDAILLESKKAMRLRQVASPNVADALALTFAYTANEMPDRVSADQADEVTSDYNPFTPERMAS